MEENNLSFKTLAIIIVTIFLIILVISVFIIMADKGENSLANTSKCEVGNIGRCVSSNYPCGSIASDRSCEDNEICCLDNSLKDNTIILT
jgi:sensor histidine kinase regulating citrate/malate metabolism